MESEQSPGENDSHEIAGSKEDNDKSIIRKEAKQDENNSEVGNVISSLKKEDHHDDQKNENEIKNVKNVDKETKPGRTECLNSKEETPGSNSPSSVVKNVKMRKSRDYTDDMKDKESLYSSSTEIYTTFSMSEDFSVSNNGEDSIRITGYLEKRSKMLRWRKFYFVLDGRLLLYYKSKADYDSLSPTQGSINLGIASTVRPIQIRGCKGNSIQIVTRTQVYYLRSLDKQVLEQWLIAIQESASSQPKISLPIWADPGSQFFRYSFAALSQWSLDASSEDITESLSTLPQNFYLKRGSESKRQPNNLHKCHSFASLQSPSAYSAMSVKDTFKNNTVQMRTKKDTAPGQAKVRQSTSMLMLESSTQAAELRKELARKLSIPGPTPDSASKLILSKAKSKSELPFLKTPPQDNPDDELHHYDEIVDIEAIYENYEPDEDDERSSSEGLNRHSYSGKHDAGIYESVEAMGEQHSWDKTSDQISNMKDETQNSQNRNSGSKRNSFISNTDESGQKHNVMRTFPALPDPPQPPRPDFVSRPSIDSDCHSTDSYGDASITTEKHGKKWKSKPFGAFFHKIFHKDKAKKTKGNPPLVITGPVDLRSLHHQSQQSPANRPTNLTINTSDGHSSLQKSGPFVGSKPAFNNENVMDELKIKVDQRNRIASKSNDVSPRSLTDKPNLRSPVIPTPLLVEKLAIKSGQIQFDKMTYEKIPNPNLLKIAEDDRPSPSEERDEILIEPPVQRRPQSSEDFQKKLAKFNTLSQRLSSSFAAALNPTPIAPTVGPLGRSRSWRVQKTEQAKEEKSPPLPPKMKNNPSQIKPSFYDYPTNNQPISRKSSGDGEDSSSDIPDAIEIKKPSNASAVTFIRRLNKKNSAPDIIFSSSRSNSGESGTNSKDEVDNVFEEFLSPPPPLPPKVKSPTSSPSLNRSFDTSTHYKTPPNRTIMINDALKDNILGPQSLSQNGHTYQMQNLNLDNNSPNQTNVTSQLGSLLVSHNKLSPSTSHKSADLDNLEALSDFSDTHASITPPDSPKKSQPKPKVTEEIRNDEQDSLILVSAESDSTAFATDSLSNTPVSRSELIQDQNSINHPHEQDSRNNLQIFIHGNERSSPFPVKSRDELDSLDVSSISSHCVSEADSIYENLRFASVNTLVQEFETVEETEDEISEMYDDFPTEFLTAVTLTGYSDQDSSTPTSPSSSLSTPSPSSEILVRSHETDSVRHSGIDQLQEYLRMESNALISNDDFDTDEVSSNNSTTAFNKGPLRPGAVSRLGHSSAVDQLQRVLRTRSDV